MNLRQGKIFAASAIATLFLAGSAIAGPSEGSGIQEGPMMAQDSDRMGNYQYMRDRRRGYDPRYQEPNTYYPEERARNSQYNGRNGQLDPRNQSVQNGIYQTDAERQIQGDYRYNTRYQNNQYYPNGTVNPNYDPNYRTDRSRYDGRHNYDPRYNGQYNNGQYTDQDRAVQVGPFRIKY